MKIEFGQTWECIKEIHENGYILFSIGERIDIAEYVREVGFEPTTFMLEHFKLIDDGKIKPLEGLPEWF